jgi:plastocyanin
MRLRRVVWIAMAVVLAIGGVRTSAAARVENHSGHGAAASVAIKGFQFQPAELTVKAGDTVEWKNDDMVPHTVTADDGSFRSGKIAPGKTWTYKATKAGTFGYTCTPHPNMHGKLTVR